MGRTIHYTIALKDGAYNFSTSDWRRFTDAVRTVLGESAVVGIRHVVVGDFELRRSGEMDSFDIEEVERLEARRAELKARGDSSDRRRELKRRIRALNKTLSKSSKPENQEGARILLLLAERYLPGVVIDSKKGKNWEDAEATVASKERGKRGRVESSDSEDESSESSESEDERKEKDVERRVRAVEVVQSVARCKRMCKDVETQRSDDVETQRSDAAKTVQRLARASRFRKEMLGRQKSRAAKRLQALFRGRAVRKVHHVKRRERVLSPPKKVNDFDSTPFLLLCKIFDKIKLKKTKDQKLDVIFTADARRMVEAGNSLYPILRLMLPHADSERESYGVREARLGRIYCKMLGLDKRVKDCDWVMNYADPARARDGVPAGDISAIIEKIVEHRGVHQGKDSYTVGEINQILDEFAAAQSDDDKAAVLFKLHKKATPKQHAYFARIVLKDMHIGMTEETVLRYYHPDALELYLATDSLKEVLGDRAMLNPRKRVDVDVELFKPFRPMLAQRHVFVHGEKIMGKAPFYIEDKLDGERLILHKKGRRIRTWSRRGIEKPLYSELLSRASRFLDADELILDGELLGYDEDTRKFVSFGTNIEIAKIQQANPKSRQHIKFMVFDVLLVNGRKLKKLPLRDRKKWLSKVVIDNPLISKVPFIEVNLESDAARYAAIDREFKKAKAARKEGLVIKKSDTHYIIGRRAEDWIKLKSDYSDGHDTFDMVILGGYYGEGRKRSGDASSFLVGIPNPKRRGYYLTVGKVGTGYNLRELADLQTDLRPLWISSNDRTELPEYLRGWEPSKTDIPHVFVTNPADSVVFEIKSAELTRTGQYSSGYTFRNPRVVRIRRDKGVRDIWTLDDVKRYYDAHGRDMDKEEQEEKRRRIQKDSAKLWERTAREGMGGAGGAGGAGEKPKTKGRQKKVIEVLGGIRKPGEYNVPITGNAFEGKQLFVSLGVPNRKDVELFIHSQGGKTTATYSSSARYFIGRSITMAAQNASVHSLLLKPVWVEKIKKAGKWLEPDDEDYLWKPED